MANKRAYIKPVLESETFVPQNYIAACGDTEYGNYLFECNAGDLHLSRYPYEVFTGTPKTDWQGNLKPNYWNYLGDYHACGKKHEAPTTSSFIDGYMDDTRTPEFDNIKVIIWRGKNNDDIHCTTNLDRNSWEIAKS